MNQRHARTLFAFTLIEMLVVIIILGIALAIALPLYASSQKDAKLKACKANMVAIHQAEEAYRVRNRGYTASPTATVPNATEWAKITQSLGGEPKCPTDNSAYSVTTSGTGASLTVTITCTATTNKHTTNPVCVNGSFDVTGANAGTP